jgi:hypothetical protein
MINIKILNNFPKEVMDEFRNLYELKYKDTNPEQTWSDIHKASIVPEKYLHHFNTMLPEPLVGLELYFVEPGKRMSAHVDRGRRTALQIPIDMDHENTYTFACKHRDYSLLKPSNHTFMKEVTSVLNAPPAWFFEWDDEQFDTYNLELPVLQNVGHVHGGANFSNRRRIFFSGSIITEFDQAVENYKNWL